MKQITLLLILCLLVQPVMPAQESNPNWNSLRSIPSGQLTLVKATSGKSHKGQFQHVTDSALELSVDGKSVVLPSAEVSRVYVLRGRPILKSTLIGVAAGGGAGAGIGAIAGRESANENNIIGQGAVVAVCAAIGIVLGTVIGLVIGSSKQKKELVYKAPVR